MCFLLFLNILQILSTSFSPQTQHELLNKFAGAGLTVTYRFTRTVSIFSPKMISVELVFTNQSDEAVSAVQITDKVWNISYTCISI